jgi:hypothetical protein
MFSLQNLTIFVIIIIVILSIIISMIISKLTSDDINDTNKLSYNIKILRVVLWLNYTVTIMTIYLMYRIFSRLEIKYNLNIFVPNIISILLNTGLTLSAEIMLQEPTQNNLEIIYVTTIISIIINILNIILLLYVYNDSKYYNPHDLAKRLIKI